MKTIQGNEKYSVFISTINHEISGYCIASINKNIGEVDSIFVKEIHRNSSTGKKLIKKSIKWLERQNIKSIKVGIAEGNESVLPFYEKLGFKKSMTILKKV
jgi:GNAT superfamily N-acetyltransferase